jgi:hypothetical protein
MGFPPASGIIVGWFGVLAETARPEDMFSVAACHLNWWALPTLLPGRRLFFLDIGLHVNAPSGKELQKLTLVLPIGIENVRWGTSGPTWTQDLFDVLHSRDICSQVFGEPVSLRDTQTGYQILFTSGSHLEVLRTLVGQPLQINGSDPVRGDLSIWEVPLESPIPAGESRYLRFRVSVFTTGTVWRWKRVWLGKAGAQIDFRIADVREALRDERERQYWSKVVPIEQLNIFFIVPPKFQARVASPALQYVRLLETGQWGSYLRGVRYRTPTHGLRVHYWRHPATTQALSSLQPSSTSNVGVSTASTAARHQNPITIDEPFRAFLDLSRDVATPAWVSCLWTAISVIFAILILHAVRHLESVHFSIHVHYRTIVLWLIGGSVIAVSTAVTTYWRITKGRLRSTRLVLRRIERSLLKPFTRS